MNVGILVHSNTGHSMTVADALKKGIEKKHHTCDILPVNAINEVPKKAPKSIVFDTFYDLKPYDFMIYAAPVWGFNLSSIMKRYLQSIELPKKQKAGFFTTHFFAFKFLGATKAIKQMQKLTNVHDELTMFKSTIAYNKKTTDADIDAFVDYATNQLELI